MNAGDRVWRERGLRDAVLAGDVRAWQTWYDESYDGLSAYVHWRCAGRRDLADEVVQETWLTAVRRVRHFDPEQGTFAQWLRGIAANLLRNHFRRTARRAGQELLLPAGRPLATADDDPVERAERVARILAELPPRYEAVLRAKYLDGHSVTAIAAAWGETPKAVESLLSRARAAFRTAYTHGEGHND